MEILAAALLVLAGLLAGFLTGAFGIGGGLVLVPVLLYYLHSTGVSSLASTHVAIGTSLLVTACASGALAWEYHRSSQVLWRSAMYVAAAGVAGALVGGSIATGLEGTSLQKVFGFVLLVGAVRLFSGKRKQGKEREPDPELIPLLGTGLLLGLVSSLTGVGGTLFAVPLLYTYVHLPLRKASGTSHAAIVVTAGVGAAVYLIRGWENEFLPTGMHGFIDWDPAVPLILGSVPGGILGTRYGAKADIPSVRGVYAVILLVVMLRMLFL